MKLFAIELSSRFGSLALVEDGQAVLEKRWEENFKNRQQLFDALADLEVDWSTVEAYAVGRGPGAFSGMRIGFSVVNALAAPARATVLAVNSGAALAARQSAARTAVVGDARRNQVWAGVFEGAQLLKDYTLMAPDELAAFLPEDALVVSPDYDRLTALIGGLDRPFVEVPCFPEAGLLGELAWERWQSGAQPEPFEPLYMHPPVFVKPRFQA